ncbi:MAG: hypothetical protein ABI680_20370 [Chthoniobacteraceae bacterium]
MIARYLSALLATTVCVLEPAAAQEKRPPEAQPAEAKKPARASTPRPSPKARTTKGGVPIATPAPLDNRNGFQKFFGIRPKDLPERYVGKKSKDLAPVAAATPEPAAKPKARSKKTAASAETPAPDAEASKPPAPKPAAKPDSTPPPPKEKPKANEIPPKPEAKSKPAETTDQPLDERARYNAAKEKALEDPSVQALKGKAESTFDPDEGPKAMRAYNKALFNKMRKIDPSVKDRIDGTEAAVMKRLGG